MNVKEFFHLAWLSIRRLKSEHDYREFQSYQAKLLIDYFIDNGVTLDRNTVLDLGGGIAGYALTFTQRGARVFCVDLYPPKIGQTDNLSLLRADATSIPFKNNFFDLIFCASLIEHVKEPEVVIQEIRRVLRPGGNAYISFPPYYSPTGGHEFSPFHYFGEKIALRMVKRQKKVPDWVGEYYQSNNQHQSFADLYKGWGLYRMTIRKFQKIIRATDFKILNISTRYFPVSLIRWPAIGEIFTWHAQFLVQKPPVI